ncbi:MAG: hypothetical protein ACRDZO_13565 [Egibacteraceae bacterium]
MLFKKRFWEGLENGSITLAFRNWQRPHVRVGGRYRTPAGVLVVDAVEHVPVESITDSDAQHAGFASRAELIADLWDPDAPAVHRIQFHIATVEVLERPGRRVLLSDEEVAELSRRLAVLDAASTHGDWTVGTLRLVGALPGIRLAELAARAGYEREALRRDLRNLRELGLTEPLGTGYRLTARGGALLECL